MSVALLARPMSPNGATRRIRQKRPNLALLVALAAVLGVGVAVRPVAAAAAFGLIALVLAFRSTEVVLHMLVGSVFVESVTVWDIRVGRIVAVVALLVVAGRIVFVDRTRVRLPSWALVPMGLYATWAIASFYWSRDTGAWALAMGQLGLALCVFISFAFLASKPETVRRVLQTLVIGSVGAAFIGFTQIPTIGRIEGLQGDANLFALYQAMAVAAALALGRRSSGSHRVFWYAAPIPIIASIFASQSRGGLVTLVVVAAWAFMSGDTFIPRSWRAPALVLGTVVLAVLLTVAGTSLLQRLSPHTIVEDRASARLDIWHVAWDAFLKQPVHGLGSGNFKTHSVELLQNQPGVQLDPQHRLLRSDEGIEVHNVYLESLTELGIPGFVFYAALLAGTWFSLRRLTRKYANTVVPALGAMFIAFTTATFFLSTINNKLLWAIIGTAAAFDAQRELR